MNKFSM